MCCWQRTSALPPWALSQQARKLSVEPSCGEKTFVNDVQAMTCTLPDPRVCILNATFSRTFIRLALNQIMWSFRYSDFVFPSSFSPTCSTTLPVCLSLSLPSSANLQLWWGSCGGGWTYFPVVFVDCVCWDMKAGLSRQMHHRQHQSVHGSSYQAFWFIAEGENAKKMQNHRFNIYDIYIHTHTDTACASW